MSNLDRRRLARDLEKLLIAKPNQDKHQLLHALKSVGWAGLTKSNVNSVLYSYRNRFANGGESLPLWYALTSTDRVISAAYIPSQQADGLSYYRGPEPRAWQIEALNAWQEAGHRGIVEAVTGTGKTTVGILATADAVSRGLRTLIIVPGLDLLDQWYNKLIKDLPDFKVGRFGGGYSDNFHTKHIIVSTVQSASRNCMLYDNLPGLLVADEVHRYGAERYAMALENAFDERLGLTATYEREDHGIERHLTPYFCPKGNAKMIGEEVVYYCGYERGLDDKILAPFRVGLIGVEFTVDEQTQYQAFDKQIRQSRLSLIHKFNCPEEPFGEFMKAVTILSEGSHLDARATRVARQYLSAFRNRRALLADCQHKLMALNSLAVVFTSAKRVLVFTETIQSAKKAASILQRSGVNALDYTSELHREERQERLSQFKTGKIRVLAAPRVLDEGVDVPEADMGVIIAANRSRRQMIQRIGRIIRPKTDNQPATFLILYVRGTTEDPSSGAHEAFLSEMIDSAKQVRLFSLHTSPRQISDWCQRA